MTPIVYLISGFGADHRAFMHINLADYECQHLDWISPIPKESLAEYASRLAVSIDKNRPIVLIGISLGGMIAVEISKILTVHKLIVVSSIKTVEEAPFIFQIGKYFPLYKLFPNWLLQNATFWIAFLFGFKLKLKWKNLFIDMFERMPKGFFKWTLQALVNWDNDIAPSEILHIHGDKDVVFPYRLIKNARLVAGGSHIMVVTKGKEISELILEYLHK